MSEDENLAVVRRAIESFENDVETWLDTLDPAVEWYPEEEHQALLLGPDAALRSPRTLARDISGGNVRPRDRGTERGTGRMCSPPSANGAEVGGAGSRLRTHDLCALESAPREDRVLLRVRDPQRSPRSRRAVGVGRRRHRDDPGVQ